MGGGYYDSSSRKLRATASGYHTKSTNDIFKQRNINSAMNPYGVGLRESRDSEEHPESFPIIIALDVTGSMGSVPHYLVKSGLPEIMEKIIKAGIKDPQVLFLAIGDHECDNSPLQVGQFESSDELLDHWLTNVYLEGGGGGNAGESYHLAWYFAAKHTVTDSFEKRGKKGVLFTIGDEPVLETVPKRTLKEIMGDGQYEDFSSDKLLNEASKMYDCYHININETRSGSRQHVKDGWKQLIQENLILLDRKENIDDVIASKVIECYKNHQTGSADYNDFYEKTDETEKTDEIEKTENPILENSDLDMIV